MEQLDKSLYAVPIKILYNRENTLRIGMRVAWVHIEFYCDRNANGDAQSLVPPAARFFGSANSQPWRL